MLLLRLGLTIAAGIGLFFAIDYWIADRPIITVDWLPMRQVDLLSPSWLLLVCIVPAFYLLRILSLTDLSLTQQIVQATAPDRVAYTGRVSKSLAPGMRLGWLVAPRRMHAPLLAAKHASDLGNPALPQLVLAHLLAGGEYERHLRTVRSRQRRRRDALLAGLRAHLPEAEVHGVAAGLHLLVTLPWEVDDTVLAERVAAAGVRVQPLSWHRGRPGVPGLVLGYAAHTPDRLTEAAERLARALRPAVRG